MSLFRLVGHDAEGEQPLAVEACSEWCLRCPEALWDVLRGEQPRRLTDGAHHRPLEALPTSESLIVDDAVSKWVARLPVMLTDGHVRTVVVRGPEHNGRRTVLRSLARALGRGTLELDRAWLDSDAAWRAVGAYATALGALPLLHVSPGLGEATQVLERAGIPTPMLIACSAAGGLTGPGLERPLFVELPLPARDLRHRHWSVNGSSPAPHDPQALADLYRITSGNLRRLAEAAAVEVRLAGQDHTELVHVSAASRNLNQRALEGLATHVLPSGTWSHLVTAPDVTEELHALESRCRNRERLKDAVGSAVAAHINNGVRALFSGPSGTGKTLAAQILAAQLHLDLYRLDLSAVVDKYIGETQKRLERAFSRAETLDVVLLIDEGDSLLGRRTHVQSSTDRYANLETNHLLQRLEAYEGILIITTNAGNLIDGAFQRRLDVVVDFKCPEADERRSIWHLHLPADHTVADAAIDAIAKRCVLTGGQIRNVVLHAALLGLECDRPIDESLLRASVRREYRRIGETCPLRG